MRQNRTDHGSPKDSGPDYLTTAQPEQCRTNKLDSASEIAKPLTKADLIEGCDHHGHTGELGAACANECTGSQDTKAE